jgi:hypothetical protein
MDAQGHLGNRSKTGVLSADNKYVTGSWLVLFTAEDLYPINVEIYHIALRGPRGGFLVYIDDTFYSLDSRSDFNEYDPKQVMYVRRGQTVSFHFRSALGAAPVVNIFARQPQGVY